MGVCSQVEHTAQVLGRSRSGSFRFYYRIGHLFKVVTSHPVINGFWKLLLIQSRGCLYAQLLSFSGYRSVGGWSLCGTCKGILASIWSSRSGQIFSNSETSALLAAAVLLLPPSASVTGPCWQHTGVATHGTDSWSTCGLATAADFTCCKNHACRREATALSESVSPQLWTFVLPRSVAECRIHSC